MVAIGSVALFVLPGCAATSQQMTDPTPASDVPVSSAGSTESAESDKWSHQRQIQACMSEKGWQVEFDDTDGSLLAEYPAEQDEAYLSDQGNCNEAHPAPAVQISQSHAEAYYEGLLETGECLSALGFTVPEPPSKQRSVDSMLSGGGIIDPLWDPAVVPAISASRKAPLNELRVP